MPITSHLEITAMRIVSLLPSLTELVYALGRGTTWWASPMNVISRQASKNFLT